MKKLVTTAAFLICSLTMTFAQFSGSGSGTSTDPYRIFNADQLSQLRNFLNQEGVYFKLQNDLDLTDWLAANYPGQGWQPVGSSTEPFKGILDGNNKTISGLSIMRTSMDYVGLFGYVTGATIKDLTLKGNISGKAYVGSLMGYGSATVTNYTFEGNVTGTGSYTGGVGGYQTTASTNLTVKATVKGATYTGGVYGYGASITTATFIGQVTGSGSSVGGLEGSASGTFSSCTVNGPVKSTSLSAQGVGGLFGDSRAAITANNCKQEGVIEGKSYTGGLVGYASYKLTISSNTHRGNITGTTYTGGAIGGSKNGAVNLTSCYIDGNITGTTSVGGICGIAENPQSSNIVGCHFWGDISGTNCLGGVVGSRFNSSSSTINFTSTVTAENRGQWDGGGYGIHDVYDSKCFFSSSPSWQRYPHNTGSTGTPYYYIKGTASIVKTAELGNWVKSTRSVKYYSEASDGLSDITAPYIVYCNIIDGSTATTAINLNVINCSVNGNITGTGTYIGGIIGKDSGDDNKKYSLKESKTIKYYKSGATSLTSLTLNSYSYSYTTSNISESYFSGTLLGTDYIGGIVGAKQGGEINNCYVSASISGGKYIGGIAGYLFKEGYDSNGNSMNSNVSACSSITGTSNVGRIYGSTDGIFSMAALGTNSENRSMASTQVVVNGVAQTITDNLQHGTAVGVSQLRLMGNYVAWGWDWNNCWTILETESFPYKTWQSAPPTFSGKLTSGATTISGNSVDGGTVYLSTSSGKTYTATCSGNTWSKTVTALHAGETVTAYVASANKEKSYFTTTTVDFSGSGTEADPYQITSAEDLQGLNKGGYYKIMNDIDLTSWINQYSSTKGWLPVGYDGAAVYVEGDNHKITGLWTNSTDTYTGLFSKLKNGYIKNLDVEVASGKMVKGGQYTGILIAYATSFKLLNCSVKGNAQGTTYVGGIVGYFTGSSSNPNLSDLNYEGTLSSATSSAKIGGIAGYGSSSRLYHTYSTAQITSTGNSSSVGGLVGNLYGLSASQCTADVNINASGTGNQVGGLFGTAGYTTSTATTISESYSIGIIKATGSDSWAGGIAGHLVTNCQLSDSYSTATITGTQYTAGLVGQAFAASKINRCYATGNLTGVYYGAGIVGYLNGANTKTTNCVALNNILSYTDQSAWASRVIGGFDEASGDPDGSNMALATMQVSLNNRPVTKYDDLVEGIAKSEAELKQAATYEAKGWDFESVWTMPAGEYPQLKWVETDIINFADANVKAICVANWDTSHNGELGMAEAAAVTDIGTVFQNNTQIMSFDELSYFTGLTSIASQAFNGCTGLASITIPENITSIGSDAFKDCTGLTKAEFASIEDLCSMVFENYEANPLYNAHHLYINGEEITELVVPNSVTSIGNYSFRGCSSLTSATIPNSVTEIGIGTFSGCTSLSSVSLPDNLTKISDGMFYECENLASVIIPESVTYIGKCAFMYSGITSIVIPNSVTTLGERDVFSLCLNLTSVYIGSGLKDLTNGHFYGCENLTKVEFSSIEDLCSIEFNDNYLRPYSNPLYYAHHLYINGEEVTDLVIPNSVTQIGAWTFINCSSITSVTIPESVTEINDVAFSGCSGITTVKMYKETPLSNCPFQNRANAILYVPAGCKATYQAADLWNEFSEIIEMGGDIIAGDANGDGSVNVTDYLAIANYILGSNTANFDVAAADVNGDNDINVSDYVGVANIILYGNWQGSSVNGSRAMGAEETLPWMEIGLSEDGKMNLLLRDTKPFSAFQMDIRLPEGVEIADVNMAKANQTKNLGFSRLQDGRWRLLYGTLDNKTVNLSSDHLLSLELASSNSNIGGLVTIDNIFLADRNASVVRLNAVQSGLPTGIYSIESGVSINGNCYDLTGRKVDNSQLKKGVYIVNGKKTFVK